MTKHIITAIICAVFIQFSFAQTTINRTAGVTYTNGVPTADPGARGSLIAVDITTWREYEWNAGNSTWVHRGFFIQEISGCTAPAFTPGLHDSYYQKSIGCKSLWIWNGTSWDLSGDDWGDQTINTLSPLSGKGTSGDPLTIGQAGATNGQVLKWNSTTSAWEPADDNNTGTTYTAGTGINVTGSVISNAGDLSATNELQTLSTGTNTLTLSNSGGTVTVDTDPTTDITTSTTANGDLSGAYPNPTVDGLQGRSVSATAPTSGQVLKWDGTAWVPSADNNTGTTYSAGPGIDITGTVISNTGPTGSGASTRVAYWNTSSALTSTANLIWDNSNTRLSIGAGASPTDALHVNGYGRFSGIVIGEPSSWFGGAKIGAKATGSGSNQIIFRAYSLSGSTRFAFDISADDRGVITAYGVGGANPIVLSANAASYLDGSATLAVGTSSISPSAKMEVVSTTSGFLPPRMTTTQRDAIASPADGLLIYNTSTSKFQGRAGGAWVDLH